jgi:hypothetical protein
MLCQFIYWRGKQSDPNGWLFKTSAEIEEETGLSYNEQVTARKNLCSNGLMKEKYARLGHRMAFLLDLKAINAKWAMPQSAIGESHDSAFADVDM